MSKNAIKVASGLARLWWLTRKDDDKQKQEEKTRRMYGKAAGTGLATALVVSQSKGMGMSDLFNLVLGNVELLILFAGMLGMFVPRLLLVLGKILWNGTKRVASWRPKLRQRTVRERELIELPEGVKCVTREVAGGTRIELTGPAGKQSFVVKRFWSDAKYARKMRAAFESVKRRYNVKHEITTLGTNKVWNPVRNWMSRDKQVRELKEMDTDHLRNTINVCQEGRSGLGPRVLDEILPRMKEELRTREVNEDLFEVEL